MESLPEHVAEIVRWIGYQSICMTDKIDVVRGQFLRMYETHQKREQEQALLPPAVRDMMKQLAGGMKMLGGGEK